MNLTANHIATKKRIGSLNGRSVIALATTGGLNLIVTAKGEGDEVEVLAAAPHQAIARHLARKKHPNLKIDALEKGDWIDPSCFQHLLPEYEALTAKLNGL